MSADLKELIDRGLLAAPLNIYGEYCGHQLQATLNADGSLTASGRTFNSLSVAAGFLITAITGKQSPGRSYYACNGWRIWNIRDAHGLLHSLDEIRTQVE